MTYAGARGMTEQQMAQTLHFNLTPDKLHPAFATLESKLDLVQQKGSVQLATANSLWPQIGFSFLPDYLALCQKDYGATITPVDYQENTEAARKTINDWVEAKTNQKIVELLKPNMLNSSNRLVLVNAVYLKANWFRQFEDRLTKNEPFHVTLKNVKSAPLMQQSGNFRYAEAAGLQILELPYAGRDLSMLILLPRTMDGIGDLEVQLTAQNVASWTTNLQGKSVIVFLPKFKVTSEFSMAKTLAALGMSDAFNPDRADFSGMDGRKDLFVSAVVHKAFVAVNEAGTEAAAATAVSMMGGGAPHPMPMFRADHPFLFLIRDNSSGSILFLGRVTDPTK
jgi:serpin B